MRILLAGLVVVMLGYFAATLSRPVQRYHAKNKSDRGAKNPATLDGAVHRTGESSSPILNSSAPAEDPLAFLHDIDRLMDSQPEACIVMLARIAQTLEVQGPRSDLVAKLLEVYERSGNSSFVRRCVPVLLGYSKAGPLGVRPVQEILIGLASNAESLSDVTAVMDGLTLDLSVVKGNEEYYWREEVVAYKMQVLEQDDEWVRQQLPRFGVYEPRVRSQVPEVPHYYHRNLPGLGGASTLFVDGWAAENLVEVARKKEASLAEQIFRNISKLPISAVDAVLDFVEDNRVAPSSRRFWLDRIHSLPQAGQVEIAREVLSGERRSFSSSTIEATLKTILNYAGQFTSDHRERLASSLYVFLTGKPEFPVTAREVAIEALGSLNTAQTVSMLRTLASSDPSHAIRERCLQVLSRIDRKD